MISVHTVLGLRNSRTVPSALKLFCVRVRFVLCVCVSVWSGACLSLRVTGRALWRGPLALALFTQTSNDSTRHRERREL